MNSLSLQTKAEKSPLIPLKYVYGGLALAIITLVAASIIANYLVENYSVGGYMTEKWAFNCFAISVLAGTAASAAIVVSFIHISCRPPDEEPEKENVIQSTEVR